MYSNSFVVMEAPQAAEPEASREVSIETLRGVVADLHVLVLKVRGMGWNLRGPHASLVRLRLLEQGNVLGQFRDRIAERVRTLGGTSPGSLQEMIALSTLEEVAGGAIATHEALELLKEDHLRLMQELRQTIHRLRLDRETTEFLESLMKVHEEMVWRLNEMEA